MQKNKSYRQNLIISIIALTLAVLSVGTLYVRDLFENSGVPPIRNSGEEISEVLDPGMMNMADSVPSLADSLLPEPDPVIATPPSEPEVKPAITKKSTPKDIRKMTTREAKSGTGRLTLFTTCPDCPDVQIFIEGKPAGTIRDPYNGPGPPSCDASRTLTRELTAGRHHISAKDTAGHSWDIMVTIVPGKCLIQEVRIRR